MFIGENIAVEISEEWKIPANKPNRELVRVGEDVGGISTTPQLGLELHHRFDGSKNIREHGSKLLHVSQVPAGGPYFLIELFTVDKTRFVANDQRDVD